MSFVVVSASELPACSLCNSCNPDVVVCLALQLSRGDMALFQDQLQNLSTTEAEIKAAMAAAEAKAVQAEQRQQEAEAQRRQTEARWQAAKQQLEHAQTEVDTLRCIYMELYGVCSLCSISAMPWLLMQSSAD